jgi:hypothetical protein
LEYAPSEARIFLREKLAEGSAESAAVLGILDTPWARAVLVKALSGTTDNIVAALICLALRESKDHSVRSIAEEYEDSHPDPARDVGYPETAEATEWMQMHGARVMKFRSSNQ